MLAIQEGPGTEDKWVPSQTPDQKSEDAAVTLTLLATFSMS